MKNLYAEFREMPNTPVLFPRPFVVVDLDTPKNQEQIEQPGGTVVATMLTKQNGKIHQLHIRMRQLENGSIQISMISTNKDRVPTERFVTARPSQNAEDHYFWQQWELHKNGSNHSD